MGMHEPGWREQNEERAWEEWKAEVCGHVAQLRRAADRIEATVRVTRDCGHDFADAIANADEASNELFRIRHGPEQPE